MISWAILLWIVLNWRLTYLFLLWCVHKWMCLILLAVLLLITLVLEILYTEWSLHLLISLAKDFMGLVLLLLFKGMLLLFKPFKVHLSLSLIKCINIVISFILKVNTFVIGIFIEGLMASEPLLSVSCWYLRLTHFWALSHIVLIFYNFI